MDLITSIERIDDSAGIPKEFTLFQNFPNPFNPSTEIRFELNQAGRTVLRIYNLVGQQVAKLIDEQLSAGSYKFRFEAGNLPSGVYLYELENTGLKEHRKMLLLK